MKNTKFIVKVDRGGNQATEYMQRIDLTPIRTTPNRKLALVPYRRDCTVASCRPDVSVENDRSQSVCALSDAVRRRAGRTPTADYIDRLMAKQERSPWADVIEEILDRICVMREEMLTIQRRLERIKADDNEEKLLKRQRGGTTMKADDVWQELYKAAVLEADDEKLQERIQAAKAAIDARLHEMQLDHGGAPEERQAVSDALAGLNVLGSELEARSHDTGRSNA